MSFWRQISDFISSVSVASSIILILGYILILIFALKVKNNVNDFLDTLPDLDKLVELENGKIPDKYFKNTTKIKFYTKNLEINWDANLNDPFLEDNCTLGEFHLVSVGGETLLNGLGGLSDPWCIGTQLVCTEGGWIRIEPKNLELPVDAGVPNGIAILDPMGQLFPYEIPFLLASGMKFQGEWDANTNTPTLMSGICINGEIYSVSVSGNTLLDGISSWIAGDGVICKTVNMTTNVWEKITGMFPPLWKVLANGDDTDIGGEITLNCQSFVADNLTDDLMFILPRNYDCVDGKVSGRRRITSDGLGQLYDHCSYPGLDGQQVQLVPASLGIPPVAPLPFDYDDIASTVIRCNDFGDNCVDEPNFLYPKFLGSLGTLKTSHHITNVNPGRSWNAVGRKKTYRRILHLRSVFTNLENDHSSVDKPWLVQYHGVRFQINLQNVVPGPIYIQGTAHYIGDPPIPEVFDNPSEFEKIHWNVRDPVSYSQICDSSFTNLGPGSITIRCWPITVYDPNFFNDNQPLDRKSSVSLRIVYLST